MLGLCICVPPVCVEPAEARVLVVSPGTGVTDSCTLPHELGIELEALLEQSVWTNALILLVSLFLVIFHYMTTVCSFVSPVS